MDIPVVVFTLSLCVMDIPVALPGAQAAPNVRPLSRGDIFVVLPEGLTVCDVSVVHPAASTYAHQARVPGGAAAARDQLKITKYQTADPNGYAFTPLSHESCGRVGKPATQLLTSLAIAASAAGVVVKGDFVESALRELSVSLCRGNGVMYRSGLQVFATLAGGAFEEGLLVPIADVP